MNIECDKFVVKTLESGFVLDLIDQYKFSHIDKFIVLEDCILDAYGNAIVKVLSENKGITSKHIKVDVEPNGIMKCYVVYTYGVGSTGITGVTGSAGTTYVPQTKIVKLKSKIQQSLHVSKIYKTGSTRR